MLFTDKASGNLFILMSARINKRKLYLCKKMGVFTIAKVVSSEKCNIILELLSKSVLYIGFHPRKIYLCKKQVNDSYFKGIDETEDYTTVETLER